MNCKHSRENSGCPNYPHLWGRKERERGGEEEKGRGGGGERQREKPDRAQMVHRSESQAAMI